MSEKPLVFYHANCADGFGAAFAAWLKLGDAAEYIPANYGIINTPQSIAEFFDCSIAERTVYILDFSFPRQVMDWLFAHAGRVVWLDHHKTAFEMWTGEYTTGGLVDSGEVGDGSGSRILLDDNKSGALLAWEYFHPGTEVPRLIQHIDDRDRWQFKLDGTKEFNAALRSYEPWSFEQWKREFLPADMGKAGLTFGQTARYSALQKEGEAILRAHEQNVQAVLEQARPCSIRVLLDKDGFAPVLNGLAANAPAFLASDLGHELANQSGTFGLCWSLDAENVVRCSLRSNGAYDVSAIAKAFGGGGHKNAAGFSTDIATLMWWLD